MTVGIQEYSPAGQANQVSSLMWLIDMLMHEAITKEDAAENRHLRTWLTVSSHAAPVFFFFFFHRDMSNRLIIGSRAALVFLLLLFLFLLLLFLLVLPHRHVQLQHYEDLDISTACWGILVFP